MKNNFFRNKPILLCVLLIFAWFLLSGLVTIPLSLILNVPINSDIPQNAGRITGIFLVVIYAWKMGWLNQIGVLKFGNSTTKIITLFLFFYTVVIGIYAYFGKVPVLPFISVKSTQGLKILGNQVFVATAEEFLFRGLILYVLFNSWKEKKNGAIKSAVTSGLLFGIIHLIYIFGASSREDVAVIFSNTIEASLVGIWLGMLVLYSGSVWPAVLLHLSGNAAIFINSLSVAPLPIITAYFRLIISDLIILIAGLLLLKRIEIRSLSFNQSES